MPIIIIATLMFILFIVLVKTFAKLVIICYCRFNIQGDIKKLLIAIGCNINVYKFMLKRILDKFEKYALINYV